MDTLCLSALVDTLIDAALMFGYRERKRSTPISEKRMCEAREAYAFVSGTGLDQMIRYYQMELDPDELRTRFMNLWKR